MTGPAPDVREKLRLLPLPQLFLTYLTGRAYTGQRGPRLTPAVHLSTAACSVAGGCALSFAALGQGLSAWLLLLIAGWAMTLHGARNLRMLIYHQCAHQNMWARSRLDDPLGKIIAGLLMVQDFDAYRAEHISDHHALHHMTLRDPTAQAMLVGLSLRAGMPREQMWETLLRKLVSPVFHARFLAGRVRSHFAAASPVARWVTIACYLAAAVVLARWWLAVLICWVLPMTMLFQVSNTLRLCVKHTFPPRGETRQGKQRLAGLTNAIFLGEAPPAGESRHHTAAWLRWATRMLLLHFPARYLVLTGDTVCHDFHHRHPMTRDWPNYIFARQADVDAGHPGWPPFREVWGLVPAINHVFDSLSRADPAEYDLALLPAVSGRALFAAFDD
ncbi:MAG TPA: fatty acid desaturase [Streptosporangiaceae bacterium]